MTSQYRAVTKKIKKLSQQYTTGNEEFEEITNNESNQRENKKFCRFKLLFQILLEVAHYLIIWVKITLEIQYRTASATKNDDFRLDYSQHKHEDITVYFSNGKNLSDPSRDTTQQKMRIVESK